VRLEHEARRHAQGHELLAECARGGGVPAGSGRSVQLVSICVDDLIITGAEEGVEAFKAQMKVFDMSDLGLLWFYLIVEVRQDASGITIRQKLDMMMGDQAAMGPP
jgi:hypothetical protein